MAWMTVADFKAQTGIVLDDALIQAAIDAGVAMMARFIFIPCVYETRAQKTQHILSASTPGDPNRIYIGDRNADSTITVADLTIYEIDSNYVEYPLVPTSANLKYGVLNFATAVPTASDRTLVVEYVEAISALENILPMMIELNQLLAVNYLFQKVPFERLQSGISNWNLNGVSVSFDQSVVQAVIDSNNARIKALYNLLIPLYVKRTTLQSPARETLSQFVSTITRR